MWNGQPELWDVRSDTRVSQTWAGPSRQRQATRSRLPAARVAGSRPALTSQAHSASRSAAQAHPLTDPDEQASDLGVAEHEVAPGRDALVARVHVGAGRARRARVGVALGRLANGDRHAECVAPGAGFRHAPIAGTAVERTPAAVLEASSRTRLAGCFGQGGRTIVGSNGVRAMSRLSRSTATAHVSRDARIPSQKNRGWSGREDLTPRNLPHRLGLSRRRGVRPPRDAGPRDGCRPCPTPACRRRLRSRGSGCCGMR